MSDNEHIDDEAVDRSRRKSDYGQPGHVATQVTRDVAAKQRLQVI